MKSKICVKCICVLLVLGLFIIPTKDIHAATYYVNVTKFSQEQSNWCWVACAKMIGNYHGRYYTQSSICSHVKGSVVNQTASLSEVSSAIRYTSNKVVSQVGTASLQAFITNIQMSRPAVLRMAWDSGGGHVYVVSGAQEQSGAALASLYLIDPIAGRSSGYFNYSKLLNGVTLASGTGKYTHTWWAI